MKKTKLIAVWLAITAGVAFAAAPTAKRYLVETGDKTVSTQYGNGTTAITAGGQKLDSNVVVITDTADVLITVRGQAHLDPGERLYIFLTKDSAGVHAPNIDTFIVDYSYGGPVKGRISPSYIPFTARSIYRYSSQTDLTDTIYVSAAIAGGSVDIEDLFFEVEIIDNGTNN